MKIANQLLIALGLGLMMSLVGAQTVHISNLTNEALNTQISFKNDPKNQLKLTNVIESQRAVNAGTFILDNTGSADIWFAVTFGNVVSPNHTSLVEFSEQKSPAGGFNTLVSANPTFITSADGKYHYTLQGIGLPNGDFELQIMPASSNP